jgi:hypothetical protein
VIGAPADQLARWIALAMAAGFALSPRLWVSSRGYPLVPVSRRLPRISYPADFIVFGALWALLGVVTLMGAFAPALLGFVVLAGAWSLWDQSRWQPWFYQYLFMLGALGLHPWTGTALDTCRAIVAATYLWSGLQKVNISFARVTFPWLVAPLTERLPLGLGRIVAASGPAVALAEAAIGVGLLVGPCRDTAVVAAVLMHAAILLCLGPLGHRVNTVVWPWNVAMAAFVLVLFWRASDVSVGRVLSPDAGAFHAIVLLLFGVLPALSFANCWDSYLSAALYSANLKSGVIYLTEAGRAALPEGLRRYVEPGPDGRLELSLSRWSSGATGVPVYPEVRIFKALAREVCRHTHEVELVVRYRSLRRLVGRRSEAGAGRRVTVRYGCPP